MLLTACDEKYLQEAKILIKSCAKHEPSQHFHLFLVNTPPKYDTVIHSWHPHINIEHVTWPYDVKNWRGIMCSARSIPIQKVLETSREPTIYLDSDTIIRKPLTELFHLLEKADLLVKYRPELEHFGVAGTKHASKFNSGVIAVRPSEIGLRFAQTYNKLLREFINSGSPIVAYRAEHHVNVYADQELLFVAYLQLQDQIKFQALPNKFNDAQFKKDSVIWHGKGTAREHPHYIKEKLYYTNKLLFHLFSIYVVLWDILRAIKHTITIKKNNKQPDKQV